MQLIKECTTPGQAKQLSKSVRGHDFKRWALKRDDEMTEALMLKFTQNYALKKFLLWTYPATLAEANPFDEFWGIGLSKDDKHRHDPNKWANNKLGKLLMTLRAQLLEEQKGPQ